MTKATVRVKCEDAFIIDRVELVKNDYKLRVRSYAGDFIFNLNGPLSALEDILEAEVFGFWRSDTTNLINMNLVDHIIVSRHSAEAVFRGTDIRGIVAKSKVKVLKKVFPHIPIVQM